MKCRQIHLGCRLNLFPGAEWLPGDTSSPSPEQRRSRKSGRLARPAIQRFTVEGTRRWEQRRAIKEAWGGLFRRSRRRGGRKSTN